MSKRLLSRLRESLGGVDDVVRRSREGLSGSPQDNAYEETGSERVRENRNEAMKVRELCSQIGPFPRTNMCITSATGSIPRIRSPENALVTTFLSLDRCHISRFTVSFLHLTTGYHNVIVSVSPFFSTTIF